MSRPPKFKNKNGDLTPYAFSCGYVQREEYCGGYKEIYMEHQHYHVRSGPIGGKWVNWHTFDRSELTKARKCFNEIFKTKTTMFDKTVA